jgi:hypothetical protein
MCLACRAAVRGGDSPLSAKMSRAACVIWSAARETATCRRWASSVSGPNHPKSVQTRRPAGALLHDRGPFAGLRDDDEAGGKAKRGYVQRPLVWAGSYCGDLGHGCSHFTTTTTTVSGQTRSHSRIAARAPVLARALTTPVPAALTAAVTRRQGVARPAGPIWRPRSAARIPNPRAALPRPGRETDPATSRLHVAHGQTTTAQALTLQDSRTRLHARRLSARDMHTAPGHLLCAPSLHLDRPPTRPQTAPRPPAATACDQQQQQQQPRRQ